METGVKESDTAVPSGIGGCLRNIFCFSAIFSLETLIINTLKPYTISQITALEKQFGLSSTRSGMLVSCDQIGYLSAILIFSHCGRSRHIPRFLAGALVLYGIAGISIGLLNLADPETLPKTVVDFSNVSTQEAKLCGNISERSGYMCLSVDENVEDFHSNRQIVFVLLAITLVILGVGKSPVTSLGIPFVDNNSRDKPQSSLLTGIITTVGFFGWTVALYGGGVFSNIPVDLSDTNLDRLHPKWIGAWWIGYLVFGGMAVLVAIPVIMFPKHIKKQPVGVETQKPGSFKEEVNDSQIISVQIHSASDYQTCSDVAVAEYLQPRTLYRRSTTFIPKYMESQFRVHAYIVNIIIGTQFLLWGRGGTLAGAVLTSKLKLTNRGCVTLITIVVGVATAVYSISLGLGCENQHMKGVGESRFNMTSSALCQCDEEFFPVCGSDSVMYSSPCTAGCGAHRTEVLVEPRNKPMVMALTAFLNGLLGYLSGPILFGSIIDSTCLLWDNTCGSIGACALYDLPQLRYRLKGMDTGLLPLATCGYFLTFLLTRSCV